MPWLAASMCETGGMSSEFHRVEFGGATARRPSRPPAEPRSDAVLVPLDQWDRILGQLGNLHEAGQQLAEARERMARAETENVFLKERLRELRERVAALERAAEPPTPPTPSPGPAEPPRRLNWPIRLPRLRWRP